MFETIREIAKGQSRIRHANERYVLTLIRTNGPLPKAEIARKTGLSAQSATIIINRLEEAGLLQAGQPVKGSKGQPRVPFSLDPHGAFSIGLKIGRQRLVLTIIDFCGNVRHCIEQPVTAPTPGGVLDFVENNLALLYSCLPESGRERVAGMGIVMPFALWQWPQSSASDSELEHWRDFDIKVAMAERCQLPVYLCNDDTAACSAELLFGKLPVKDSFTYFHIGAFIGGGIVLNGQVIEGRTGNAGALGSLPVSVNGKVGQLLEFASLNQLRKDLRQTDWETLQSDIHALPPEIRKKVDNWLDDATQALVQASIIAQAIHDAGNIIIDGSMAPYFKALIVERIAASLDSGDWRGVKKPVFYSGSLGDQAQLLGSANLPLIARYYLSSYD
ncbi:ROK family transcriptional regulator [Salinimonas sp. HHU 13199]|uniref:ROK family transcriptional regulator n=1 Tax=Salinimonas profundi TaxID=2729140 RepID=A0ABR8LJ79_9ALTE|nr:ROK family transcriptional regulator [Salinimonas profundi]MBD3586276.1 ROK family transcriptional regulator [Salinimonas profundi]